MKGYKTESCFVKNNKSLKKISSFEVIHNVS